MPRHPGRARPTWTCGARAARGVALGILTIPTSVVAPTDQSRASEAQPTRCGTYTQWPDRPTCNGPIEPVFHGRETEVPPTPSVSSADAPAARSAPGRNGHGRGGRAGWRKGHGHDIRGGLALV